MGIQDDNTRYKNKAATEIANQLIRFCEGYLGPDSYDHNKSINNFGRPLITDPSADLSFILGLTMTGLRSGGIIGSESPKKVRGFIKSATRQLLPVVFHSTNKKNKGLRSSGAIQLYATSAQQVIDFTILAHRISELALVPCVNNVFYEGSFEDVKTLTNEELTDFLGNPDDIIDTPTPAQEIIFGAQRRRLPHYYSLDQPMQLGVAKDEYAAGLEKAAKQGYFYAHISELFEEVFTEFAAITGRQYNQLLTHNLDKSECLIITDGGLFEAMKSFSGDNPQLRVGVAERIVEYPSQSNVLRALYDKNQPITVLQHIDNESQDLIIDLKQQANNQIIRGTYIKSPSSIELVAVCENMKSENPKNEFYIGFDFTKETSLPKHQVLLQQISRAYPDLNDQVLSTKKKSGSNENINITDHSATLPLTVRQYKDGGVPFTRLNRFYDDTALFYETDNAKGLVADPFQALPSVPPVSTSFSGVAQNRVALPVFNSASCTGCGECFVQCPYSAIPPIAIGVESLLNAGMQVANAQGAQIAGLMPMIKNIAKTSSKVIKESSGEITTAGDFLQQSFDSLMVRMKITGEKLNDLYKEFALVQQHIASLPVAITDTFFNLPEQIEKGSGALFSLAVDSSACTGCGICSKVCDEDALVMTQQDTDLVQLTEENLQLWEKLPDTTEHTINRLLEDQQYDSIAAVMLSRSIYLSMTGSGRSEPISYAKTMMHIVSSVGESIMQPRYATQDKTLKESIKNLSDNIHDTLSDAIPKDHFDGIQKALQSANGARVPFEEVMSKVGDEERLKQISAQDVTRKIDLLHNLRSLDWLISEGPTGTGRARFSLALSDGGLKWANQYPGNPFTAPAVVLWDNAMVDLSIGLVQGHLRYLLDNIKLLRRADMEVKNKYVPAKHDREIASLSWTDLTDMERGIIPPVFIVGDEVMITSALWAGLAKLMQLEVPVKVIVLDSMDVTPGDTGKLSRSHAELMSLIALKSTFVFQGGLGNRAAMFEGLIKGISSSKPAFYRLLAPSPGKLTSEYFKLSDISAVANNSRSFPTIEFDPEQPSRYLNAMINLDGNPDTDESWQNNELQISDDETVQFGITWADWAYTQNEWADHFRLIENKDEQLVAVSEYVSSNVVKGAKTPVIYRVKEGEIVAYAVSDAVIDMVKASASSWDMLREVAGVLTAFPDKLKAQVLSEVEEAHQQEIEAMKKEFQAQLDDTEQKQMESVRLKLKNKLVELANKKAF